MQICILIFAILYHSLNIYYHLYSKLKNGCEKTDINAESISVLANAILLPTAAALLLKLKKYGPELIKMYTQIQTLQEKGAAVLVVITDLRDVAMITQQAMCDQRITPEEATGIIKSIDKMYNSKEVKALMEEFAV